VAASGVLTFAPGDTVATVTVAVNGDTIDENDETLLVNLSNASGGKIVAGQGVGTILDDDPMPTLSISDAATSEGQTGTKPLQLTIQLSKASGRDISVMYATLVDSAGASPATPGVDFTSITATVVIPAGATKVTVPVDILADLKHEPNETFLVQISAPVNATIARATALATIRDDDPIPTIKAVDGPVYEANSGSTVGKVKVSLSNALDVPVSVDYTTAAATTGNLATSGVDYTPVSGTLVIPAGAFYGYVEVPIVGDLTHESNEVFQVLISNPVNGVIGKDAATVSIVDNDPIPTIKISDASTTEGKSGTKKLNFSVTLSNALDVPISVDYATAAAVSGNLAQAGVDYLATAGTLTIPAGSRSGTISIDIIGDLSIEPDEVFQVLLSNPVNGTIGDGSGLGTIRNDDAIPTMTVANASTTEGNSGTKTLRFTVTLSNAIDHDVSVEYATAPGTATEGVDYRGATGTLVIASGATIGYVSVTIFGDTTPESDETFFLNFSNISGGTLVTTQAVGTLVNDD
jgi:hypothetical protein